MGILSKVKNSISRRSCRLRIWVRRIWDLVKGNKLMYGLDIIIFAFPGFVFLLFGYVLYNEKGHFFLHPLTHCSFILSWAPGVKSRPLLKSREFCHWLQWNQDFTSGDQLVVSAAHGELVSCDPSQMPCSVSELLLYWLQSLNGFMV